MNLIKLNSEESKLYFASTWYKNLSEARLQKLIKLAIIKRK